MLLSASCTPEAVMLLFYRVSVLFLCFVGHHEVKRVGSVDYLLARLLTFTISLVTLVPHNPNFLFDHLFQ